MRSLLRFIKELWGFLVFVLAMNVLVTNCVLMCARKRAPEIIRRKLINIIWIKYVLKSLVMRICQVLAKNIV